MPARAASLLAGALVLGSLWTGGPAASAATPASFFGVQAWSDPSPAEFAQMARGGVGTYRANMLWSVVEYRRRARNWGPYDALVSSTAQAGITVLPVLLSSPRFAARRYQYPPRSRQALSSYSLFVRDAVRRYGSRGSFWRAHPELPYRPVRAWQVWNEPNFPAYWNRRPSAREYVGFLRLTRRAVKRVDRGARIVLAGIPDTRFPGGVRMVPFLQGIYRAGARGAFEVMAVHPYARRPGDVITAVRKARAVMARNGDSSKSVWVTEIGWATGGRVTGGSRAFKTTEKGQASRLGSSYRALLRARDQYRIGLGVWFSWRDRGHQRGEPDWWAIHTGLFDRRGHPKPAWRTYAELAGGDPGP